MTVDDLEIPPPSGSLFSLFLLFNPLFIHLKQFINICFSFRKCNYHSKFPIFTIMTPSEISPESVREFLKVTNINLPKAIKQKLTFLTSKPLRIFTIDCFLRQYSPCKLCRNVARGLQGPKYLSQG